MAKKKIPGIQRPYTFSEFFSIIEQYANERGLVNVELDYFNVCSLERDTEITDYDCEFYSETRYGGSEGIYTVFYMRKGEKVMRFATAKNLCTDDENFVNMHVFGAKITLLINETVWKNREMFEWSGYNVGHEKDGKRQTVWICARRENAEMRARELLKDGAVKVFIRDNATRKITEYEN